MSVDGMRVTRTGDRFRLAFDEVIATDQADLWDAVTSPQRLARWMTEYRGDPVLGGTWTAMSDGEAWGTGTVTSCDPPNGFTSTWTAHGEPSCVLTVRLEPVEGGTRLHLDHDGVPTPTYGAGWAAYVGMLHDHVADAGRRDLGEAGFEERYERLRRRYEPLFADAV